MLEQTGCDGIMVARGAEGNPWIFAEITKALAGEPYQAPTLAERQAMILEHLQLAIDQKGEFAGMQEMKKHLLWYTKGLAGAAALRRELMELSKPQAVREYLTEAFAKIE